MAQRQQIKQLFQGVGEEAMRAYKIILIDRRSFKEREIKISAETAEDAITFARINHLEPARYLTPHGEYTPTQNIRAIKAA